MAKKIFFSIIALILFISLVAGSETDITVNTLSNHDVSILILANSDSYSLLEIFNNRFSGQYGNVSVTYAGDEEKIKVQVLVKENGQSIFTKKFEDIATGSPVSLEALPDWVESSTTDSTNQVSNTLNNLMENVSNNSSNGNTVPINLPEGEKEEKLIETSNASGNNTGFSSFSNSIQLLNMKWILGILFIVIFSTVIFIFRKQVGEKLSNIFNNSNSIKVHTKYDHINIKTNDVKVLSHQLKKTNRELINAQKQIEKLKNEGRIKELENKIEMDKRELEKLRKGY